MRPHRPTCRRSRSRAPSPREAGHRVPVGSPGGPSTPASDKQHFRFRSRGLSFEQGSPGRGGTGWPSASPLALHAAPAPVNTTHPASVACGSHRHGPHPSAFHAGPPALLRPAPGGRGRPGSVRHPVPVHLGLTVSKTKQWQACQARGGSVKLGVTLFPFIGLFVCVFIFIFFG